MACGKSLIGYFLSESLDQGLGRNEVLYGSRILYSDLFGCQCNR